MVAQDSVMATILEMSRRRRKQTRHTSASLKYNNQLALKIITWGSCQPANSSCVPTLYMAPSYVYSQRSAVK